MDCSPSLRTRHTRNCANGNSAAGSFDPIVSSRNSDCSKPTNAVACSCETASDHGAPQLVNHPILLRYIKYLSGVKADVRFCYWGGTAQWPQRGILAGMTAAKHSPVLPLQEG